MAAGNHGSTELITKVNVTPIIDVALVLVIILLVTAPMIMVPDMPVNLPVAESRGAEDERNLSITLGSDGSLAIDREAVAPRDLERRLREHLAEPGNADMLVVVRADAGAPYTRVGEVLTAARSAGATHLAIATRQGMREPVRQPEDEVSGQ
jgi:biopolymer transport protein TolR